MENADPLIMRRWAALIRSEQVDQYVEYVTETGMGDYQRTPGNCGAQLATRDLGDGTTEVSTISWWESLEAIVRFAGEDYERARYYPEDDRFLVTRPPLVEHCYVRATSDQSL